MIPVTQTKRGGPDVSLEERGDCFDACLASILEVGIRDVPCPHGDGWWDAAQAAVARHGHRIVYLMGDATSKERVTATEVGTWLGRVHWLAAIPSLNLGTYDDGSPVLHVVVMRGRDLVHDPSLGERYPLGPLADEVQILDVMVLMPLAGMDGARNCSPTS